MTTGHNRYGRAGKGGAPVGPLVAFLDHYTYQTGRTKYINGEPIPEPLVRQIRRWRNNRTTAINPGNLLRVLESLGFSIAWFHTWCNRNGHSPSYYEV